MGKFAVGDLVFFRSYGTAHHGLILRRERDRVAGEWYYRVLLLASAVFRLDHEYHLREEDLEAA